MRFLGNKDWKNYLPIEDEKMMNKILFKVERSRGAYMNSKEPNISQLWCAVLELWKQNQSLQRRINRLDSILDLLASNLSRDLQAKKELYESLDKF